MTQVRFVRLNKPNKAPILCELSDQYFQQRKRCLIHVQDDNQAVSLDRFLWTWDKGGFLPHAFDNGSVDCLNEPVVITIRESNPNNANVLILAAPCQIDFIRRFDWVIDFAELYDPVLAEKSRERFRIYRTQGFDPQML